MNKLVLFTLLILNSIFDCFSQETIFISQKQLFIKHNQDINISQLYLDGLIFFNTPNDTPYSRIKSLSFKEGWMSFYDFSQNKFIPRKNKSKKILPLKVTFHLNDAAISDSEYSKFKILTSKDSRYECLDISEGTNESGFECKIIIIDDYLFLQYKDHTYVYSRTT